MLNFLKSVSALNDETRVLLLKFLLKHEEMCVCDLQKSFNMIQSRLSRHLKILKEAGFVRVERRGRWAYYGVCESKDVFIKSSIKYIDDLDIPLPVLEKINKCSIPKV